MKKITLLLAVVLSANIFAQTTIVDVNFANYTNGALVGQNSWAQYNTASTEPLTVNAGVVTIAGARTTDNQDAVYPFAAAVQQPASGTTVLNVDAVLAVTSAGVSSPSYFMGLNATTSTTYSSTNYVNARLAAIQNGDGFVFGTRVNGQSGYPFAYGTTKLTFGTYYAVRLTIKIVAGNANDIIELYVGSDFSNLALHSTSTYSTGTVADPTFGAILISQYGGGTSNVVESGVNFKSIKVTNLGTLTELNNVASSNLSALVSGKNLLINNVSEGAEVEIFSALGSKVQTSVLTNGKVSIANLKGGLYVVRCGKLTQKVVL